MKKGILYSSLAGFGLVLVSLALYTNQDTKEYYTPREVASSQDGFKGAAEWLHRMRANQITGKIDPKDIENARLQAAQFAAKKSGNALGLSWENMGPNDLGGRTRCFIIDKNNPDIMFIGSVSGGLFKSTNAGSSWAAVNDMADNLAVVSLAQAANGDIYYGTGEGMYYQTTGTGTGGVTGKGLYKSTDGGTTFSQVSGTSSFAAIGKIVCGPNDPNRVYIATNQGIRVTTDGGATWANPLGVIASDAQDMTIDGIGQVWVRVGDRIYKSDGTPTGFTEISKSPVGIGPTDLPRKSGRTRIAVSPQDPNYVYVISTAGGNFDKAYRSTDGGGTWTVIGENNFYLNPHGAQGNGQGEFDNAVTVDANNKDRILVGGVTLWEWTLSNGWELAASIAGGGGGFPYYVHADMHHVVWHPTKPNFVYALNDGGIFRSKDNGETWDPISKGYVSAQFYSIAVGANGKLMGGTQDNGTIFIDPANYYPESGVRTPGVNFLGSIRDGDGGYTDLSKLNDEVQFKEMQYGVMGRSTDGGESYEAIYDFDRMDPNGIAGNGSATFADFVMPFILWEKLNDPTSTDSVIFSADSLVNNYGAGGGDSVFDGSFVAPHFEKTTVNGEVVNTTATLNMQGFTLDAGNRHVTVNSSGQLVATGATLKGSSFINMFNDPNNNNLPTIEYKVSFDSIVKNDQVIAKLPISYNSGDKVIVKSRTNDIDMIYALPSAANSVTNPEIAFQDAVQSMFFVGLRTNSLNIPSGNPNDAGGIWMTRDVLTNLVASPQWYHIGSLFIGETPQTMAVSGDGDALFVGTTTGRLYRFSNLSNARDSASADIDDFYTVDSTRASTSVVVKTLVKSFGSGRSITSISTHPFDKDKLVVTLGNYGNTDFVYYSNNASAAMPTLVQKDLGTSGLPDFPVYSSTFNYNDPNGTQVIIGTEEGIYTTDDISSTTVSWTKEINGMANVAVFDLIQQQTVRYDLYPTFKEGFYEGAIYAGTHGRGIFRTGSTSDYIGIKEVKPADVAEATKVLNVYPNPATDRLFIDLALESRSDVSVTIRSISGQMVKNVNYNKLSADVESIEVGVSNLAKGTYVITLTKGAEVISGKFIKQ